MATKYSFNPFVGNFDTILNLDNPLQFIGGIALASDFPTSADVEIGHFYKVTSDVTDNDASKTNTGQSFLNGDEIAWNGTDWTVFGNATIPGGSDGDLQINDSGVFGTIDGLNLDKTGNARGASALDIQSSRSAVDRIATSVEDITFGIDNKALGNGGMIQQGYAIAVGRNNVVVGTDALIAGKIVAVGHDNSITSTFNDSSAFGVGNVANEGTAIGNSNTSGSPTAAAIGLSNTATSGVSVGTSNTSIEDGVAVGYGNNASPSITNGKVVAIGNFVNAIGYTNTGIGNYLDINGNRSVVIGSGYSVTYPITSSLNKSILFAIRDSSSPQDNLLHLEKDKGARIGATSGESITMDGDDLFVVDEIEAGGDVTIGGDGLFTGALSASNLSGTNTGDQDLSGLVPYTGATSDVDLGNNDLTATQMRLGSGSYPNTKAYINLANTEKIGLYIKGTSNSMGQIGSFITLDVDYDEYLEYASTSTNANIFNIITRGTTSGYYAEDNTFGLSVSASNYRIMTAGNLFGSPNQKRMWGGTFSSFLYGAQTTTYNTNFIDTGLQFFVGDRQTYTGSGTHNTEITGMDLNILPSGYIPSGTNTVDATIYGNKITIANLASSNPYTSAKAYGLYVTSTETFFDEAWGYYNDSSVMNNFMGADDIITYFGTVKDAGIWYDGTDLIVDPRVIGSGVLNVKAPIEMESNSLLGTPQAGTIEFANDRFYVTNVGTQRAIDRTSDVITSTTTVTNTVTETTLWTGTVGANSLKVGNLVKIRAIGEITNATASDDITFNIYIGSTLVQTYAPAIGNVTNEEWAVTGEFTVRSVGASGSIAEHSTIRIAGNIDNEADDSTTIDTTAAEDITVKVQWANAKAGNTISIYQGWLEFKN